MEQRILNQLRESRELKSNSEISLFLESLEELSEEMTVEDVSELCDVFYDDTCEDEIMFDLIHLIERYRGQRYLEIIASCTPNMTDAHEWAMLLNKRIINSEDFYKKYIEVIDDLDIEKRDRILALLIDVKNDNPKRFSEKVDNILKRFESNK